VRRDEEACRLELNLILGELEREKRIRITGKGVSNLIKARNESQLSIYIRQFRKIDPNRLNFAPQKTLSFKS